MRDYRQFFDKYLSGADFADLNYVTGFQQGAILTQLLKQCGDDLSRENSVSGIPCKECAAEPRNAPIS
jgi:branched-chain amino acid transport system substrate-binding protein